MMNPARNQDTEAKTLQVSTRFGTFDVNAQDVLTFPHGLPGFEPCHHFVLVSSDAIAPLQCLHGIDGPPASFVAIDPRVVLPDYRCTLSEADRVRVSASADAPLVWLALVAIADDGTATANLRAPIVINPERMVGYQLVPQDSLYPLRHPLD